jgi:hypothetical protein
VSAPRALALAAALLAAGASAQPVSLAHGALELREASAGGIADGDTILVAIDGAGHVFRDLHAEGGADAVDAFLERQ